MRMISLFLAILISHELVFCTVDGAAFGKELIVYYRSPESPADHRLDFINEIIPEHLDRTVNTDGPYKLKPLPQMVFSRFALPSTQKEYPNIIMRLTGDYSAAENFEKVPIPFNRGIVGFRTFLIRQAMQKEFDEILSLADLQASGLTSGQGRWSDVDILKENNIPVMVGKNYDGLFGMLMASRFDYFPRGINEAFEEMDARQALYPEMQIEKTIALFYPLPRVLVTNKGNTSFSKRIERGLKAIIADGTHRKIWLKYNRDNLIRAHLDERKIFILKNSKALPGLPYNQKEYWYQPGELM